MEWRDYIDLSEAVQEVEAALNPVINEFNGGMQSTANTMVEKRQINIDVSQEPLKSFLGYAYELKNLENAEKYQDMINLAKEKKISKSQFIKGFIQLEAEAVYFRCMAFKELGLEDSCFPYKKDYLKFYDESDTRGNALSKISTYVQEEGIVRRSVSVKKYYADCYDFYSGKNPWPSRYESSTSDSFEESEKKDGSSTAPKL